MHYPAGFETVNPLRELKIGTSSVRGVVGEAFTPELAIDFACAFGTWAEGLPVVLGWDSRGSSEMFRSAVTAGLISSGCQVVEMGLAPTPLTSFAVREMACGGAISVTGSHNDEQWNALKFIGPDGALLDSVKGEELLDLYHASSFARSRTEMRSPVPAPDSVRSRYLEFLLSSLEVEAIGQRRFRIAIDFCNGSTAEITKRFLRSLNCELMPLNEEPHGRFPRNPVPAAEHLDQLVSVVREAKADLGAALNIDGDRIAFVTGEGEALSEECTLPLVALDRLRRRPGIVVTNLSTSARIDQVAEQFNQSVVRTSVGESFVIEKGLEEGAVLAGEGSGGVAVLPATATFDALLSLGFVLELMACWDRSLAQMAADLPRLHMRKGEIRCPAPQAYRALEQFRKKFAADQPDLQDGIRVDWEDGWCHVRVSSTEPVLRIIAEAAEATRADQLFNDCLSFARTVVSVRYPAR